MASPFSIFRKHQRVMLAVVGILAMIAFVFIGPWSGFGPSETVDNPVKVTWSYGDLRESDLERMQHMRAVLNRFLSEAVRASGQFLPEDAEVFKESEEDIVETMLLAKEAERLGVVVSDAAVNAYIKGETQNKVTREQLTRIINNLRGGQDRGVSQAQLFEALRRELLARSLREMFQYGLVTFPPGDRFDQYARLHRFVTALVLPVDVKDYVGKVEDPTPKELKAFFEEYQHEVAGPEIVQGTKLSSPKPGFKTPFKAEFQYFQADKQRFIDTQEVTEAEIQTYYEKNKAQFRRQRLPAPEDDEDAGPAGEGTAMPRENSGAPSGAGSGQEVPEQPPLTDLDLSDPGPVEGNRPAGEATAFYQGPAVPANRPVGAATADAETPGASSPAGAATTDAEAPESVSPAGAGTTETGGVPTPVTGEGAASAAPEYEPLDQVRDEIELIVARQKANDRMAAAIRAVQPAIAEYYQKAAIWGAEMQDVPGAPAAPPSPFEDQAKQFGLAFSETPLLSAVEAAATEFADLGDPRQRFLDAAFVPELPKLTPLEMVHRDTGDVYVIWKVEEQQEYVPPLEKALDEVKLAWKMEKAQALAREAAEKIAADVRAKNVPLPQALDETAAKAVEKVGEFTWLTYGSAQRAWGSARLTLLSELDNVGPEFMRVATDLEPNQVGVALNHPRTVAYVIQVVNAFPSYEQLREEFVKVPYSDYADAGSYDREQAMRAWIAQLEKESGLHWEIPPAPYKARQPRMPF